MYNVLEPLAIGVLIPLVLAASAADIAIHKKQFRSGTTTLIMFSDEMNDIMKIAKSPEESGLLMKGVRKTIPNKQKNKKADFSACD